MANGYLQSFIKYAIPFFVMGLSDCNAHEMEDGHGDFGRLLLENVDIFACLLPVRMAGGFAWRKPARNAAFCDSRQNS